MDWSARVRAAFGQGSNTPDDDVIEELAQHAGAMHDAARADGCSPEEADRRVAEQLEFWRLDARALQRRSHRPAVVTPPPAVSSPLIGWAQDVRYTARLVRRQPRHALLTIVLMALGIGATTVLFSVTYALLMRPFPWPRANAIVVLKEARGGSAPRFGAVTNASYLAWQEEATTIDNIAAWSQRSVTLVGAGDPERIRITAATASLFPTLGMRPLVGSFFEQDDETSKVIVLSEDLWRQRFSADPAVLGRSVDLDGERYTVVGVLPDDLAYPDRQTKAVIPYSVRPAAGNYLAMFNAIAALRPDVTPAQAAAEGTARGRAAADTGMTTMAVFGNNGPVAITAQPLRDALTADVRGPLIVLLVAVGLLLATATANVASLQLARATTRSREMAIRAALGAGRARVIRQFLIETLLVVLAGGAAGLTLTWLLNRSLPSVLPGDFPRIDDLSVDSTVVLFALVISIGTSIACGLLPAVRVCRLNPVEALAEDGMAPVGASMRSRTARTRMLIMAGQMAIASVLLVGASLVGRSFVGLLKADRGYDASNILSARLSMPVTMYPAPERRRAIVEQIVSRVATIPGVTSAAFTSEIPLTPGGSTSAFELRSPTAEGGSVTVQASPRIVSPRYFSTLGMRIIAGRAFADSDTDTSESVVVVNRAFARRYLGSSPLGWRLPVAGYAPTSAEQVESTVIGVVDDVRYVTAANVSQPELYYSLRQMRAGLAVQTVTLLLRTSGDPSALAPALRPIIREADERLVADAVMPLEQRLLTTLARPRLYAMLLAGFAAFSLLIAAVGVFGGVSYSVSQRSRELAVRAALGARQADILQLIMRQGLSATLGGLAVGMVAATWLTRLMSTQLYGITPHDTFTFVMVPLLLLAVGAAACFLPAQRAAKLDLLRILRGGYS